MTRKAAGLLCCVLIFGGATVGFARGGTPQSRPDTTSRLRAEIAQLRVNLDAKESQLSDAVAANEQLLSQLTTERNAEIGLANTVNDLSSRLTPALARNTELERTVAEQAREIGRLEAALYQCQHP